MSKKWSFPLVGAGALAAALLFPTAAMAERHDRDYRPHRHHWSFSVGVGPAYGYGPAYPNGYYDAWGVWHPYYGNSYSYGYGFYDRWGRWHPR